MNKFWQDFRYAARVLGKNPGVTAIMVFTLALAIGATTAIFSVVYGVLLRPLPYSGADRIMAISEVNSSGRLSRLADPNFDDFRDQSHSFQSIAKYTAETVSVSGGSSRRALPVAAVTPQFLTVFGVEPIIGRDFTATDNQKGAAPVALVSYGYWRQYLGLSAGSFAIAPENQRRSLLGDWRAALGISISRRRGSLARRRYRWRESKPHLAQLFCRRPV